MAGCGGGGGGTTSSGGGNVTTITPYKGAFERGDVVVKNVRGETVATGQFIGGRMQLTIPKDAEYPITVYATGTYRSEATGLSETTTTPIRSVVPDAAAAAKGIAVTPLTEIAAAVIAKKVGDGEPLDATLVKSTVTTVAAAVLTTTYDEAMRPPEFSSNGKSNDRHTMALSALALSASTDGAGLTMADRVKDIGQKIANGISPSAALPGINAAVTAVTSTSGISSMQDPLNPILGPTFVPVSFALTDPGTVQVDTLKWENSALVWDSAKWR